LRTGERAASVSDPKKLPVAQLSRGVRTLLRGWRPEALLLGRAPSPLAGGCGGGGGAIGGARRLDGEELPRAC
jgi:hypothetical protein